MSTDATTDAPTTDPDAPTPAWSAHLLPHLTTPLARLVVPIADDELISGHRAQHWTGVAPSLEADLAFSTIAQDEVNHADTWYSLLVDREADDARDRIDALGLGRTPDQYRHARLCELPPGDFVWSLARHWAYDHADAVRLGTLVDSSHSDVAGLAAKLLREERYHLLHADQWFDRLTAPGAAGRDSYAEALRDVLPRALWLFEPHDGEDELIERGLLPTPSADLRERWLDGIVAAAESVGLDHVLPDDLTPTYAQPGGRHGVHGEDFTHDVWPEMTTLHREHPGASW